MTAAGSDEPVKRIPVFLLVIPSDASVPVSSSTLRTKRLGGDNLSSKVTLKLVLTPSMPSTSTAFASIV